MEVANLLGCSSEDISMEDSFIDAGIDSIMLAQLRVRLQDRLCVALEGTALMQNPSVEALAGHISRLPVTPAAAQSKVAPPSPVLEPSYTTHIPPSVSSNVIHEDVTIPNGVRLGDFVTIGKGTVLGPGRNCWQRRDWRGCGDWFVQPLGTILHCRRLSEIGLQHSNDFSLPH